MEITITSGIIAVIVCALVEVAKGMGINEKFAPLWAIGFGIALSGLALYQSAPWVQVIFIGIIAGLSAVGLYSGGKNTVQGLRK